MILTISNNRRKPGTERPGFTLLEITLVLALLAVVAVISWPPLEAYFKSHRLRQAVDAIRTQWVKGRTLAMEEGRPYRFAWMPEARSYRLAPHDMEHWPELSETSASVPFAASGYPGGLVVEQELPEGVRFTSWERMQSSLAAISGGWSNETILFWPDGTARIFSEEGMERPAMELFLIDNQGQTKVLQLRALTGGVTVLDVRRQ